MDFDITKILIGSTALGLLAGFWQPIKAFLAKIVSLLIQQVEVPTEQGHDALVAYLIAKYRRSGVYDRMFGAWWDYRRDGRYALIPYESFGQRSMIFWNGWIPFLFHNQRERKPAGNDANRNTDATKIFSVLTFIRGTLDLDALLHEACTLRNRQTWDTETEVNDARNRFVIHYVPKRGNGEQEDGPWSTTEGLPWYAQRHYRLIGMTPDDLGKARNGNGRALETLIFPPRVKALLGEIELWRKNRAWYQEKGIPWKRGWLLYGPPGTGKTALARAFAEDLNMPIYVFNLAEMSNHELIKAWSDMQVNVPCIALIEDIDNVFHGRENIARKNSPMSLSFLQPKKDDDGKPAPMQTPLTFDTLLNCLDGVERSDGIFTIITTNEITKVDAALGQPRKLPDGTTEFISTRPGRIDKAVELTYMEAADRKRMARRILAGYDEELEAMLEFVDRYPDLQETPAQFQERCGQIALKRFWAEQEGVAVRREEPATWIRPLVRESAETASRGAN